MRKHVPSSAGHGLFLLGQSVTDRSLASFNFFASRQMATFVLRWPMENGCARVVRVPGVQSIRELETCRERKPTFDSAFHELS